MLDADDLIAALAKEVLAEAKEQYDPEEWDRIAATEGSEEILASYVDDLETMVHELINEMEFGKND